MIVIYILLNVNNSLLHEIAENGPATVQTKSVIPAKAGIQNYSLYGGRKKKKPEKRPWILD